MSERNLEKHGIKNPGTIHWNLSVPQLIEEAVRRGEGILTDKGAINSMTGERTGRSPNDRYVVEEASTKDKLWWGKVNVPIAQDKFEALLADTLKHLEGRDLFVKDAFAGADPRYRMPIRAITEFAWHNLFVHQLFRRASAEELDGHEPSWTVINACNFRADPKKYGLNSECFVILDFSRRITLIGGTHYAGEMKKSIFAVLNYQLPQEGVFPMHCSANIGNDGDAALFFGLSGTGKTTLSADPDRGLIGDDEHGWSDQGVFNFEGGCYAKCIKLSEEREPEIWRAIKFGSVVENVIVDPQTREPDYNDDSITENTRCAYPLDYIDNAVESGICGHPKAIIFLAADAFGVLPAVARLSPEQAMYHFMSGYTAKVAGTEAGASREPSPTFSTCFGSPFLPLTPQTYAHMLADKMKQHNARCYLINSGWVGNAYGAGPRIPLRINRVNITQILDGTLDKATFRTDPIFGFEIPESLPDVEPEFLDPRQAAKDADDYDRRARDLAGKFEANFEKYADAADEIKAAGPKAA